jgi:hypothetical protein
MSSQKYQYNTQAGVVIIKELRNSASEVTGYEGVMMGDDGHRLTNTLRVVQVCGTDKAHLREVRHAVKDAVFDVFLKTHQKMAMKREPTRVAEGVAKIVHRHLCIGARENNLIPS